MAMERVTRHAEVRLGAYTWWQEEYLQLFTPSNYVDRGRGRLLMYGPSESREAFLPERFDARLPDLRAYQNAQSIGTIEDFVVVLDYIEQAYGSSAVPEAVLLGVTTRLMANIRSEPSPLYAAINKYSPVFRLDESTSPPKLVRKTLSESFKAHVAFRLRQQRRYRSGLRAVVREALIALSPALADSERLRRSLTPSKYHHLAPRPIDRTIAWLNSPTSFWAAVHAWVPSDHRESIRFFLERVRATCSRHGSALYVVNLPELSHNRALYRPGRYEAYLDAVRSALPGVPLLDLREALSDELFYDSCHPTLSGSIEVSDRIAAWIAALRDGQAAERS